MVDVEDLLGDISDKYELVGKSPETMGNQYKVYFSLGSKKLTCNFHTNIYDELIIKDIVGCLIKDKEVFDSMYPNHWTVDHFRREFGYSEDQKSDEGVLAIMDEIEKNTKSLKKFFTKRQLKALTEYYQDY